MISQAQVEAASKAYLQVVSARKGAGQQVFHNEMRAALEAAERVRLGETTDRYNPLADGG